MTFHLDRGGRLPEQTSAPQGHDSVENLVDHQPALPGFPGPDVVEVTLRVGLVASADHMQWQLEARCPLTGELLSMHSVPHRRIDQLGPECSRIVLRLRDTIREALGTAAGGETAAGPA